jgi:hypothetical protein
MALSPLILSLDVVWLAFRLSGKRLPSRSQGKKTQSRSGRAAARRLQGLNRSGSAGALWIARPDEIGIGHDHPSTLRSCVDGEQSSKEHGDKPAELTLEL